MKQDYDLCESMLNKWRLQSCKNYEFGHYLQALLKRKKGKITESLKYIKLCHMIDPSNQIYLKELTRTLYFQTDLVACLVNRKQHLTC